MASNRRVTRQDFLFSAMMSTAPHFPRRPDNLVIQGETESSRPVFPKLGASAELCAELIGSFHDMRHLTELLTSVDHSATLTQLMSLDSVRSNIEYRLLSLEIRKSKQKMQHHDYLLEVCRVAALMFLHRAFHGLWRRCTLITQLRNKLKGLLLEKESRKIDEMHPPMFSGYYTYVILVFHISLFGSNVEYRDVSWDFPLYRRVSRPTIPS